MPSISRPATGLEIEAELLRRSGASAIGDLDDLFFPVISDTDVFINLSTGKDAAMPRSPIFDLVNDNEFSPIVLTLGVTGDGKVPGNNESENPDPGTVSACLIMGTIWETVESPEDEAFRTRKSDDCN